MSKVWKEKGLVKYPMICTCKSTIPENATRYPVKPQRVKKRGDDGREETTFETHVVKCPDMQKHPEATEYNYVVHARLRGKSESKK